MDFRDTRYITKARGRKRQLRKKNLTVTIKMQLKAAPETRFG